MRIRLATKIEIRTVRDHSATQLMSVAILLAGHPEAIADPKRRHFYELLGASTVYYVYVSPVTEIVFLIATWKRSEKFDSLRSCIYDVSRRGFESRV